MVSITGQIKASIKEILSKELDMVTVFGKIRSKFTKETID